MGWLIALAAVCGLAFLPLGIRAIYRDSNPGVWLLIGPVRLRLYPGRPKKEKADKAEAKVKGDKTDKKSKKGRNAREFEPIVRTVLEFLDHFRRKIRVTRLELKVVLAGDDPCDLAVNYGRAWAALGSFIPQLERFVRIRKRDIEVECDFTADTTLVYARVDAALSLTAALYLLSRYGIRALRDVNTSKKLRKGGA